MNLKFTEIPIILGSQSPRRKELLHAIGLDFSVEVKNVEETFPDDLPADQVAEYVALKKLEAFTTDAYKDALVITADTVVVDHTGVVLGKPTHLEEAKETLRQLSGRVHQVFTGVGILFQGKISSFTSKTEVLFEDFTPEEIDYYINEYKPLDKAGSYGIQEWIGRIGVKELKGTYENVMGLPTSRLYQELKKIEKGL